MGLPMCQSQNTFIKAPKEKKKKINRTSKLSFVLQQNHQQNKKTMRKMGKEFLQIIHLGKGFVSRIYEVPGCLGGSDG